MSTSRDFRIQGEVLKRALASDEEEEDEEEEEEEEEKNADNDGSDSNQVCILIEWGPGHTRRT